MSKIGIIIAISVGCIALAATARGQVIPCVAPHTTSPVDVSTESSSAARIYFRRQATTDWYFIDLKQEPGGFYGVLPSPQADTVVEYQIEMTDAAGKKLVSSPSTVAPTSGCKPGLTPEQKTMASNLVLGKQSDAAADIPPGFDCDGIIGELTASGELKTMVCKKGPGVLPYVAGGAFVVGAAGGAIYENNRLKHASPSRP